MLVVIRMSLLIFRPLTRVFYLFTPRSIIRRKITSGKINQVIISSIHIRAFKVGPIKLNNPSLFYRAIRKSIFYRNSRCRGTTTRISHCFESGFGKSWRKFHLSFSFICAISIIISANSPPIKDHHKLFCFTKRKVRITHSTSRAKIMGKIRCSN